MMNTLTFVAVLLAAQSLLGAPVTIAQLTQYAQHAFTQCPSPTFAVEPVTQHSPAGFDLFKVTQTSTDQYCGAQKFLLVSPKSGQTILGTVIPLPDDPRPVHVRISEHASNILKAPITARIAPMLLPDGLKAVTMTRETPFGQFAYNGYIDASEKYLVVGMLGNLNEKPEKTLRDQLGLGNGARRGTAMAKNEIIELSDFECPSCGRAHKQLEPLIAKNVAKVNYIRLDLPLFEHHDWSFQAAMGARAIQRVAPAKYWEYVNTVFGSQEILTKEKIDDFVKNFAGATRWMARAPIAA
ncbi:MAG: hypothetical protein NVSMB68_08640 [Thermoanaerobaculia bacterium]